MRSSLKAALTGCGQQIISHAMPRPPQSPRGRRAAIKALRQRQAVRRLAAKYGWGA